MMNQPTFAALIAPAFVAFLACLSPVHAQQLTINEQGYFDMPGLNVTVFSDIYPEGHQTGVTIIQHGVRVAANGDLRLEASPGQWSPVPKGGKLTTDKEKQTITQRLWYPDTSRNRTGFNPIIYPDLAFSYGVRVTALKGNSFRISVDLDKPLPADWIGRVGFNFELFPGHLFGKSYLMDGQSGHFPHQPNGPLTDHYGGQLARPLATGRRLVVAPEADHQRLLIESSTGPLELWDGRTNHNNGWFIVRTPVTAGATRGAVEWVLTPNVVPGWTYEPVIQVSQVGYHPDQSKRVVIEQDGRDLKADKLSLYRATGNGLELVRTGTPSAWGKFLRYQYLTYDFSDIREPGMYVVRYRNKQSHAFQIGAEVFDRHVWQPTLEYFLPVQMCHVRVNEKYRVWHGACHLDDALMAPVDTNHFDGYVQGPSTLTKYTPYQPVTQLNQGGWHDAGDDDLRVESQIETVWTLALMIEEFGASYDATLIDQEHRLVEIHQPDGKSDVVQQIEHGLLSVLGAYRAMGRLYRGIISNDLRQYVMLGDWANMTDNLVYHGPATAGDPLIYSGKMDDRWVFTEQNPDRELFTAGGLAAASRVLRQTNPALADECLQTALALWNGAKDKSRRPETRIVTLCELILATGDKTLINTLTAMKADIIKDVANSGWAAGRVMSRIPDQTFRNEVSAAVATHLAGIKAASRTDSPYGVPYKPNIWGAGWTIQRFGFEQYFFWKGWPEHGSRDLFLNALNFVLGVHPGDNTASFASGVGAGSALTAYGFNRADWSHIPGGIASGTALIRPDLPEFKVWPFFWQQTEYVLGGGTTDYMFLAMAAQQVFSRK